MRQIALVLTGLYRSLHGLYTGRHERIGSRTGSAKQEGTDTAQNRKRETGRNGYGAEQEARNRKGRIGYRAGSSKQEGTDTAQNRKRETGEDGYSAEQEVRNRRDG